MEHKQIGSYGIWRKALEYHRLLEAIDLLNKRNITMEEQSMSYGGLCRTECSLPAGVGAAANDHSRNGEGC